MNYRLLLVASAAIFVSIRYPCQSQSAMGSRLSDTFLAEHDLIQAIKIPFDDPKTQFFDNGFDGFPAFGIKPGSDIKSPYRLFMPEKLYGEFSIIATIRPNLREGGFLFAVVNPLETVVQLGVQVSSSGPTLPGQMNISLLYTDVASHFTTQTIASFVVATFAKKWTRFGLKVTAENVTLFFNCHEYDTVAIKRTPQELVFDSASTLYVGQAGPIIKGPFDGSLQELKLYASPTLAEVQCDAFSVDQEDGGEGEASGEGIDTGGILPPHPPPPPPGVDEFMVRGPKGERGERGPRGPPGESIRGPPGPPGPPGPTFSGGGHHGEFAGSGDDLPYGGGIVGPPGPPGICACNITSLLTSFPLPDVIPGPPGIAGIDGKAGPPGTSGLPGPPGERGAPGPRGDKGDRGDVGSTGQEGIQGSKGEPGRDGLAGIPGSSGPPGPPGKSEFSNYDPSWKPRAMFKESILGSGFGSSLGRPGSPGPKGEPGTAGTSGVQGERGVSGSKGDRGDPGLKGPKGDRGHQGPSGSQGFKGEQGSPGIDGLPGFPGANGRDGSKGQKGESGELGKTGPPGPPGPPSASHFNLDDGDIIASGLGSGLKGDVGPQGDRGDTGPKGEKGDRGPSGLPGIPGSNGLQGPGGEKGEAGELGPSGPSGAQGLKGDRGPPGPTTVASMTGEFITIKGEKGDQGKRGRRGKQGTAGKPGTMGEIGLPGWMHLKGNIGRPGSPGFPGSKGDKGDPAEMAGFTGKGEKGDRGSPGLGLLGPPGPVGPAGPPGPPGPSGPGGDGGEGNVRYVQIPGPPGKPGPPGISLMGQKGEPGSPATGGRAHVYGDPSMSAPPPYSGRPGSTRGSLEELKELKALSELKQLKDLKDGLGSSGSPGRSGYSTDNSQTRIVPGAVTFQNTEAMTKMSSMSPVGTLAYVIDEEVLLVRVNNGWQYILLGSLLPITTQPPPTTTPQPIKPPFEASNLIGNKAVSFDGAGWYPKMLRMAALNEPWTGDMTGVRGADYSCYRQSRRAGLRGTFRAFLSSRVQNLDSIVRFSDRDLPVVNIKGDVLFNSWNDMFKGDGGFFSQQPRIFSFSGKNILTDFAWSQKIVWHGSHVLGERAMDTYCDAWHSASTDKVGLASSLLKNKLLEQERFSCNNRFAVLCIEATSQSTRRRRRREIEADDSQLSAQDYQELLTSLFEK